MSVPKNFLSPPANYDDCLSNLKERIRHAQTRAALAVNQELILLYWQIGWEILSREREQGWGAGVVERLARDLKREFPAMKGFSARNIRYMKSLAEAYPDEAILQRSVARLPWRHNIALLEKLKSDQERIWYAQQTIENGWSRDVLVLVSVTNFSPQFYGHVWHDHAQQREKIQLSNWFHGEKPQFHLTLSETL